MGKYDIFKAGIISFLCNVKGFSLGDITPSRACKRVIRAG